MSSVISSTPCGDSIYTWMKSLIVYGPGYVSGHASSTACWDVTLDMHLEKNIAPVEFFYDTMIHGTRSVGMVCKR